MEWNGTPTITEPPSVECQDLLIPNRSMHGDDLRFQSKNDEISRLPPNSFFFIIIDKDSYGPPDPENIFGLNPAPSVC